MKSRRATARRTATAVCVAAIAALLLLAYLSRERGSDVPAPDVAPATAGRGGSPVWLGIVYEDVSREWARALGLRRPHGVFIDAVAPKSPADGILHEGDVITTANGREIRAVDDLRAVLGRSRPGDRLILQGYRGVGQRTRWTVTLAEQTSDAAAAMNALALQSRGWEAWTAPDDEDATAARPR